MVSTFVFVSDISFFSCTFVTCVVITVSGLSSVSAIRWKPGKKPTAVAEQADRTDCVVWNSRRQRAAGAIPDMEILILEILGWEFEGSRSV